jgi:anti-anti-sigma regulatory factor
MAERVIIAGPELEAQAAPNLQAGFKLALSEPGDVRVDLQMAAYAHTAVVQVLLAGARACAADGRKFAVSGAAPELRARWEQAGLDLWL